MSHAPLFVRAPNPLVSRLLRIGLPAGPNVLLTVKGRTSGLPRSAPVAVPVIDGRRYAIGAYGDVHWVRNLRAAGVGEIRLRGKDVPVTARELDREEAGRFFAETLPGYVASLPWMGRLFGRILFRIAAPEILNDPDRAAATRPVFELTMDPWPARGVAGRRQPPRKRSSPRNTSHRANTSREGLPRLPLIRPAAGPCAAPGSRNTPPRSR